MPAAPRYLRIGSRYLNPGKVASVSLRAGIHDEQVKVTLSGGNVEWFAGQEAEALRVHFGGLSGALVTDLMAKLPPAPATADTSRWPIPGTVEAAEFSPSVSNVQAWDRVLTPDEIKTLGAGGHVPGGKLIENKAAEHGPKPPVAPECNCPHKDRHASMHDATCPFKQFWYPEGDEIVWRKDLAKAPKVPAWATADDGCGSEPAPVHSSGDC